MATEKPETPKGSSKLAATLKKVAIVGWGIGAVYFVISMIHLVGLNPSFFKHGADPKNAQGSPAIGMEMAAFWVILIVSWLIYAAGDRLERKDTESQ